jgi:putative drug exporter of the RND superfamily
MARPLYWLGSLSVRHRYIVLVVWLVGIVALALVSHMVGSITSDDLSLPGYGSQNAQDLLQERFPSQANGSNPIVLKASQGKITDSQNASAVDSTVKALEQTAHVTQVVSPLTQAGKAQLSPNGKIAYISVTLNVSSGDLTDSEANKVVEATAPAKNAGLVVGVGGYVGAEVSQPATEISEVVGIAAAMLILLVAFGTAVAMAMPIVTATLGLVGTLSLIAILGHAIEVPSVSPTLATMIGLGVGIDYALFIITRHRRQLAEGIAVDESIARAVATGGGAVVFAGTTVVIALCSLAVAGIPLVTTLGFTAAIAVAVAVLAAVTLLPAILRMLGEHINSLRVSLPRRKMHEGGVHGWRRWAGGVAHRPWIALVAAVVVLGLLASPIRDLSLGQKDTGALPKSTTARKAYDLLSEGFGTGINGPLLVAVKLDQPAASPSDPRLQKLDQSLSSTAGVSSASPPLLNTQGTAAIISVTPTTSPSAEETRTLVRHLRSTTIPQAVKGEGIQAYVGGLIASYIDLADDISGKLPLVIAVVVALSFLVLMMAFRSLLVPLQAAAMNLLSVLAAYGVLTAIFEIGRGNRAIGLPHTIPIVSYVPLMLFAILFGLSMDYEVFLVTQIKEHYQETKENLGSVVDGLANTGKIITSAALIMFCVFAAFVVNGDPTVKQFGVGLATAILIDATVVRCLLVPAVMVLSGKANWWLPRWLDRILPRISIEGEGYFEQPAPEPPPAPAAPARPKP